MKILAFESSCDETAAAVVEDGRRVLSGVIASQVEEHRIYGGVVPEIAGRRHIEAISAITEKALSDAGLTMKDIDAVAVTYAPGLIGALLVGVNFAKSLACAHSLPLVPVHHLRSHVAANYVSHPDLEPPFFALVVSGGHTHMIEVSGYTSYKIVGRTVDDAAGEALDKAGRRMGFPYPGGLNMDRGAADGDPDAFVFPRPKVHSNEDCFSFSGLKTAALNIINQYEQKGEELPRADLGASFQKAVVSYLCDNTERALLRSGEKKLVLAGGVSANSVLRKMMTGMCAKHGVDLFYPDLPLCGDNAVMVASQGYYEFLAGKRADLSLNAYATMNIENG